MSGIGKDYLLLCFLSSMGVLQIAASYGGLHGLLLLRARVLSAALGLLLVLAGFLWFFLPGPRLVPDKEGGLDGNQQSLYFALSAGAALVVTLVLSSLVNRRRFSGRGVGSGLDALRHATYWQAMTSLVTGLRRRRASTSAAFRESKQFVAEVEGALRHNRLRLRCSACRTSNIAYLKNYHVYQCKNCGRFLTYSAR